MKTRYRIFVAALVLLLPSLAMAKPAYIFDVFLDDKKIGSHVFSFSFNDSGYLMQSSASYNVKVLFIDFYNYSHSSRETWNNGCLEEIASATDDNGENYRITGRAEEDALALVINDEPVRHEVECPRTFVYWQPELLATEALVNSQTGELEAVTLVDEGTKPLPWSDAEVTQSYRLETQKMSIELWYGKDNHWLGLRSTLDSGRTLSYRPAISTLKNNPFEGVDAQETAP
ncbi:MAG: DUF6134 family protein [Porticoccaceae bacterium]|nr:DUF6134 family protein [Porticoccaceae bacterium]